MKEDEKRIYFFDTSALVKRYHREVGTDVVDAAFEEKDAARMISDISMIEFYSAFAKKVRTGEITKEDFLGTISEMAEDIQSGVIQLAFFSDSEKRESTMLIEKHGLSRNLRTLDAMQLAVMRKLGPQVIKHVYCADRSFATLVIPTLIYQEQDYSFTTVTYRTQVNLQISFIISEPDEYGDIEKQKQRKAIFKLSEI